MGSNTESKGMDEKTLSYETSKLRDYSRGIDLLKDTDEDVLKFIGNRVEEYALHEHQGDDLWWYFYDDFKEFTKAESFIRAGKELPRRLRDVLRKRGGYIPKDKKSIAGNLVALLKLDEPPVWPATDKEYDRVMGLTRPYFNLGTQSRLHGKVIETKEHQDIESKDRQNIGQDLKGHSNQPPKIDCSLNQYSNNSEKDLSTEYDQYRILNYKPHGFSQQLATLAKIYDNRSKYSGIGDTFDYKFDILLRQCENADIPKDALVNAFSIMLKDDALDFYYNFYCDGQKRSLEQMCKEFKDKFEGIEHKRSLLKNWNNLTFETVVNDKDNVGKSTAECLQIFTRLLTIMQHGLDINLRNDAFIHNKLVTACEKQPAFKNVCERPAATLFGLVNDLRSAAEFHDRTSKLTQTENTFLIDRRYHQGQRNFQSNQYRRSGQPILRNTLLSSRNTISDKNKCLICKKEGCWSTMHSKKERDEAFNNIKLKMKNKIDKNFSQYCQEIEGMPPTDKNFSDLDLDNNSDDIDNCMENFIFDTALLSIDQNEELSHTFTTEFNDELNGAKIAVLLANQATEHAILANSKNCNLKNFDSRYGPSQFQGIVIDTGAANYSTGGYNQWTALQKHQKVPIDKSTKSSVNVQFGIGATSSIGSIDMITPIGTIKFHIVEANTPFLLCLKDMDSLGVFYNNLTNRIQRGTKSFPIIRRYGHAFLCWGDIFTQYITQSSYLSENELRQLHRRFGHPSVRRFVNLMTQSDHKIDQKRNG
ncbi:hypothetical protein EV44_g3270 [Erysiphe necator]|uniref:Uncharacterized protein n=1 Tax=Uncinula necator TaxID=52586 RepID=A0A0B1P4R2_UNCNE|nr:hypothetical protein EV44_g3270 [Erysiphe necator]